MSNISNRKRPPKLNFSVQETQQQPVSLVHEPEQTQNVDAKSTRTVPIAADHKGATSATACDSCNLESTVRVQVGDREDILISPDSLLVCEQLGRGQYGIVEKVNHQESGCYFAVKRVALRPGDTSEQTRLLMDVDILVKGTECKNIIKFFGALLWEGDLWILMELMDCSLHRFYRLAHKKVDTPLTLMADLNNKRNLKGSSLVIPCAHVTEKVQLGNCDLCNPIPERVLGRIAADIVNALSYLYSIKVIHRDIKPSNILINRVGVIKLCDFGISGYLVNSVARTYEAGCRPYMAPERIDPPRDRTGYDIKSDVWSFGITMLEIATGRYPYHNARDFFEQLKAICADEPPRLTKGRFTAVFENFVAECLHKNYQLRPKYEIITTHKFIRDHKDLDIREFTERILTSELGKVSANS